VRIGLVNNLRAGRSNPEVRRILRLLENYPEVVHIETTSVRSVPEALASLARQNVELLVVNGGDGTLQYTLTQMLTTDDFPSIPMVAPLRGGRTNMTAMDLGLVSSSANAPLTCQMALVNRRRARSPAARDPPGAWSCHPRTRSPADPVAIPPFQTGPCPRSEPEAYRFPSDRHPPIGRRRI